MRGSRKLGKVAKSTENRRRIFISSTSRETGVKARSGRSEPEVNVNASSVSGAYVPAARTERLQAGSQPSSRSTGPSPVPGSSEYRPSR